MARGFDTTYGTTNDDIITPAALTADLVTTSLSMWIWVNSYPTQNIGFQTNGYRITTDGTPSIYWQAAQWSGGLASWRVDTPPATGEWHHLLITYDGSSSANAPVVYVDGISQTVGTATAASGTWTGTTNPLVIGNRVALGRAFDGILAEWGLWNVVLDAGEAVALAAGYAPSLVRSAALVEYNPLLNDNISLVKAAPTVSGAVVQPHPRAIYHGPVSQFTLVSVGGEPTAVTAFEGFQSDAFQGSGYLQASIRTAFQPNAFQQDAFQIQAKISISGQLAVTLQDLSLSATGLVKVRGSLDATLDALTLSATGKARATGTASITLDDVTLSATGQVTERRTAFQPDAFQNNAFQIFAIQEQPPEPPSAVVGGGGGDSGKSFRQRQLDQIYREDEEILEIIRKFVYDEAA